MRTVIVISIAKYLQLDFFLITTVRDLDFQVFALSKKSVLYSPTED